MAPTGGLPYSIIAEDIDGDGKKDIIVTSTGVNKVSIYLNTSSLGQISLAPSVNFDTGTNPYDLSVGDLDNDGKLDIVVSNYLSNSISVYKNTSTISNISFLNKVDFSTGLGPRSVKIGDLNNDGKLDLGLVNELSNTVSIFRNNSSSSGISFAARTDLVTETSPIGLSISDIDRDNKLDIAAISYTTSVNFGNSSKISFFKNISTSTNIAFNTRINNTLNIGFNGVVNNFSFLDIDGDSKPDLIISGSTLFVYKNESTSSSFLLGSQISYFGNPFNTSIGDFDADGKTDMASTNYTTNRVFIYRNTMMEPRITSYTPNSAATGETVTINGSFFSSANMVSFGGIPATSFTVVNENKITAIVGSGASGTISVRTPIGTGVTQLFAFKGPPIVQSFAPINATTGDTVIISGLNLNLADSVKFGGVPAKSFSITSPTQIRAVIDTGASGAVSVKTPYGTNSLQGFTYIPVPIIRQFTPTTSLTGGLVTILGRNFIGTSSVTFGGVPSASFTRTSDTSIVAVVSSLGASGSVSVSNTFGTASKSGFTFIPQPAITAYSPAFGINGTILTITGTNLNNYTGITIGGTSVTGLVNSATATQIVLTLTNAANINSGNIIVTSAGGVATATGFLYYRTPVLTSCSPVFVNPGNSINIKGRYFLGTTSVLLGGNPAASFIINSDTSITAIVGLNNGLNSELSVTNPAGTSNTYYDFNFTSAPIINSFSPKEGTVGSTVTIIGSGFNSVSSNNIVYFGAVKATVISSTNSTLTVTVPVGATYSNISVLNTSNKLSAFTSTPFVVTFSPSGSIFNNTSFVNGINLFWGVNNFNANNSRVEVGDFDGDGKPDLLASSKDTISIFRNTSNTIGVLSFGPRITFRIGQNLGFYMGDPIIIDFNGDGKLDFAIKRISGAAQELLIFINSGNSGNISFESPIITTITTSTLRSRVFSVADINLDGKPDLVGYDPNILVYAGRAFDVFINTSTANNVSFNVHTFRSFTNMNLNYSQTLGSISTANLNINDNNPRPSVILAVQNVNTYFVYKNKSRPAGLFVGFDEDKIGNDQHNGYINAINCVDLDKNDKVELIEIERSLYRFAYGDLDGDGKPDKAVTNNNGQVVLFKNISQIGQVLFNAGYNYTYSSDNSATDLKIVDLDGDSKPEIVLANQYNGLTILRNQISTVVPLSLLSFNAGVSSKSIQLQWITVNEINTDWFDIEHSIDAINFNRLGNLKAAGTSTNKINYEFIHHNPISGSNYYRLKMIDKDGKFVYSQTVSVINNDKKNALHITPNPVRDKVVLRYPIGKAGQIQIVDYIGRVVKKSSTANNSSETTIDISNLPSGIYKVIWFNGVSTENQILVKH